MVFPIIDLHCDLLFYLENSKQRTAHDLVARCSIPQLHEGQVKLQTLAIFTQTGPQSVQKGLCQVNIYQSLPLLYPKAFKHYSPQEALQSSLISTLMAFENASGFCEEHEPLREGIKRLNSIIQSVGKPLYISLTWNTENRFGGGALTQIGLKEDGKHLLEELHHKQIAIDLSHASDALAYEVLDYIEGHSLNIPLMASHSNSRAIRLVPRNLPDEIAKEIFRRKGVVGLNLCHKFVGETIDSLPKHIAHWLELGGEHYLALGADFFYEFDLPASDRQGQLFFPQYQDASCYGRLLDFLQKELRLKDSFLKRLAYQNALEFLNFFNH